MVLSFEAGLSKTFTSALLGSSRVWTSHAIIITRTGKIRFRIVIMTHVFILCAFSLCTFYRFPTTSSKVLIVKAFQVSFWWPLIFRFLDAIQTQLNVVAQSCRFNLADLCIKHGNDPVMWDSEPYLVSSLEYVKYHGTNSSTRINLCLILRCTSKTA